MTNVYSTTRMRHLLPSKVLWMVLLLSILYSGKQAAGQIVSVGSGSYSTSLPFGATGPQNSNGQQISPKISAEFSLPIQSNDFWSSLIYPFFSVPYSNVLYAHPLNVKAVNTGLQMGYTTDYIFAANDYLYPFSHHLTVGVSGLSAPRAVAHDYGDWTVTALWESGARSMEATLGHGLPYVFFKVTGDDAVITSVQTPSIWHNQDEVLGITIDGIHYAIFAPAGSTWTGSSTFRSSLNGKDYLSVAVLPDNNPSTLELFRTHAYAFVTNSTVEWEYDEGTAELSTTYSYDTELKEGVGTNVNETLTALYRHQWLYTDDPLTNHTYQSPNGLMKLYEGNSFSTKLPFSGVLPSLHDRGDYNKEDLLALVQSVSTETLAADPSYESGKAMGRFSNLVHIADQLGAITERDYFLSEIKKRLEDWFTVGGAQEYSYIDTWNVLTGYPSGFGADNQINDHHFHSSYAIMSAATVARFDSDWASQEKWGGMVNLLIKDSNNWDRTDEQFPFLRSHDSYAGHSWAAGHGDFGDGNNQESSSESMNFASAVVLWGELTNQKEIRDLGIFLYTTEQTAAEQYWFDVDNEVFPPDYPHVAIGMVWGGKGVHSTWFGADPEFVHGINILPMTSGSLYLGRHPDYILANYNEIVAERNGQPTIWQDVLWEYLALADADLALSYYYADNSYVPFDGESRAHTLHWLYNLKKMGRVDTSVFANIPTYAVFKNEAGEKTYVVYNAGSAERVVTFTDGYSLLVPPNELTSFSTAVEDPDAPVPLLLTDKISGKAPLRVEFEGGRSFDRGGGDLSFAWEFGSEGFSFDADTEFTFDSEGEYWVTLTVVNSLALAARDSVLITVLGNGTAFLGTPSPVPGRIEAEHYDLGGEGRAYHDADANNIGLAFRPNEGVDLEASNDQGFDVYWITAGEWLEYTIQVDESGLYDFKSYMASVPGFGNFRLLIDNVDVSGQRSVTHTGGWQFWKPFEVNAVPLEAGVHIMRFEFDSATDKTGWLFSFNYVVVERSVSTGIGNSEMPPQDFVLHQNYPNPFSQFTSIRFELAKRSHATLTIYNLIGQEVAKLLDDELPATSHEIEWNVTGMPAGVYFYALTAGDFTKQRTMVLLK